jgi:anti-sigma factor RsiW
MHLNDGQLRSYLDGELDQPTPDAVEKHLSGCKRCSERLNILKNRAQLTKAQIGRLQDPSSSEVISIIAARTRFERAGSKKEYRPMLQKLSAQRFRLAWTAGAIVLIVALFAIPQVRALGVNFLGLFRVEQVTIVPFNLSSLDYAFSNTHISSMLADSTQFEQNGERTVVTSAPEAAALAGIPVRMPANREPSSLIVEPGGRLSMTVDLARIRALLDEIGRQDIALPDNLDDASIVADLPISVTALFGKCDLASDKSASDPDDSSTHRSTDCTELRQMQSPSITAPPDLDIDQIGTAFLQIIGMSASEAEAFGSRIDWASTLVLPIPSDAVSREVQVDGVTGIMIQPQHYRNAKILIWVKEGVLYYLQSFFNTGTILSWANSLE